MTTKHADGTICKAQTPESCPFYEGHVLPKNASEVSAALSKREELDAQPKKYNVLAFEKKFAKWFEKFNAKNETPDVVANKITVAKIAAKDIDPLNFYKEDNGFIFGLAGERTTNYGSDDNAFWVEGKTLEEAVANLRDPKYSLAGTEYDQSVGRHLRKYFQADENNIVNIKKRNKAVNKIWNDQKRFYNWDIDSTVVGKMHAYGKQIDKQYPELDDNHKAIILAQTLDRYQNVGLERFKSESDNIEWAGTVASLWAGYKIFENETNK